MKLEEVEKGREKEVIKENNKSALSQNLKTKNLVKQKVTAPPCQKLAKKKKKLKKEGKCLIWKGGGL